MIKPATPLPWTIALRSDRHVVTPDAQSIVASFIKDEDALHAVHAANCHAPLVEALDRVVPYIEDAANDCRDAPSEAKHDLQMVLDALTLARGEEA